MCPWYQPLVKPVWCELEVVICMPLMLDAVEPDDANAVPEARATPLASVPARARPAHRVPVMRARFAPIMYPSLG